MAETSGSTNVSMKLWRIAKLARETPQAALTTLAQRNFAGRRTFRGAQTGLSKM